MRKNLIVLFFLIGNIINAQTVVNISGQSYINSDNDWIGVNIQRSVKTALTFKNNYISSRNTLGYLLQIGDEEVMYTNNNLDNALVSGNRLVWDGTPDVSTHGIIAGYNINQSIKYNYLNNLPYGIVYKSGTSSGSNQTNTYGTFSYNVVKNGNIGVRVKGYNGVRVYNNTFYTTTTTTALIYITNNDDISSSSGSSGTKIFNNIFYTSPGTVIIYLYSDCRTGFECDYNIYYCDGENPLFSLDGKVLTWSQWRALGYDSHSVILNPGFVNTTSLVPSRRLDYGKDLGSSYATGLSTDAGWGTSDPGTASQNGTWQVGAYVFVQDAPEPVYQSSLISNNTPSLVELTYNLTLANIVPSASAFTVTVGSSSRTINSVAVSGTKVLLTLSAPVSYTDAVTVAYTKPSSGFLQTPSGGAAASFSARPVTNSVYPPSPVYQSSVVENASPSRLDITYDLALANVVPAASAFTVRVNSVARTVSSVSVSGTKVSLTLASAVVYGDAVTVAYSRPSSNPLQSVDGGQVQTMAAKQVTNNVVSSVPVFVSAAIENASPSVIEITFSSTLASVVPVASAFPVVVNSSARTVNSVAVSGTKVTLTLAAPAAFGDVVTVAYNKPASSPLQGTSGGQVASITARTVTNKVGAPAPVYSGAVIENASPSKLEISYTLSLANVIPPASAFTVRVGSVARSVSSVAISGTKVILTLASPVVSGDIITVAYTKPASNPVQSSAGAQAASFSAQSVANRVNAVNAPPVIVVNYKSSVYSGFVSDLDASGSYDSNKDNLSFSWVIPDNIPVSSTSGSKIQFLSPVVQQTLRVEFKLNISDGKVTQTKSIPVDILPYEPQLDVAEVVNVTASSYQSPNYPSNIIDGNIGTMWSVSGDNQWIILQLKEPFAVQHVKIAFLTGQKKESYFDILGSEDNVNWEPIMLKSGSCDFSGNLQVFDFPPSKTAKEFRYIKVVGHCNSADAWNYISEFRIFGYKHKNPSYENQLVTIYPNPAREFINVKIEDNTIFPDFIRIISMSGKIMIENKVDPGVTEFQMPVDLKKGLYLVQIGQGRMTVFSQKLIVSN